MLTRTESQKCNYENSVKLVNRFHNGKQYEEGKYFVDNTTGMERGCVCMKEICARKCCPFGQGYEKNTKKCIDLPKKFEPPIWEGPILRPDFNITKEFHFLFNKMNCSSELRESRVPIQASLVPFQLQSVRIIIS